MKKEGKTERAIKQEIKNGSIEFVYFNTGNGGFDDLMIGECRKGTGSEGGKLS